MLINYLSLNQSKKSLNWFEPFQDKNQYDVNAMLKWLALEISNRSHYTTVVLGPNKFSRFIFEIHFVKSAQLISWASLYLQMVM